MPGDLIFTSRDDTIYLCLAVSFGTVIYQTASGCRRERFFITNYCPESAEFEEEITSPESALINVTETLSTGVPLKILYIPPYI